MVDPCWGDNPTGRRADRLAGQVRLIIAATHNPLLSAIVASLSAALSESRILTGQEPDWELLGMIDLKEVAEAIARRDPLAAQEAMIRHLDDGKQRYQRRMANLGP